MAIFLHREFRLLLFSLLLYFPLIWATTIVVVNSFYFGLFNYRAQIMVINIAWARLKCLHFVFSSLHKLPLRLLLWLVFCLLKRALQYGFDKCLLKRTFIDLWGFHAASWRDYVQTCTRHDFVMAGVEPFGDDVFRHTIQCRFMWVLFEMFAVDSRGISRWFRRFFSLQDAGLRCEVYIWGCF